jgi:gliding motility-associated lipoprotein GldH
LKKTRFFIASIFAVLAVSCDSSRIYEQFDDVDGAWYLQDPVSFSFEVEDSAAGPYDMDMHVNYSLDYNYYNLYYQFELIDPQGQKLIEELKEVILFEPKTGKPLGSGLGSTFDITGEIDRSISLDQTGTYTVNIYQFMRTDTLKNIQRIGFKLSKSEGP